jgi:hypothetical protein
MDDNSSAGTTDFDAHDVALQAILAEWSSKRSYATRVPASTVFDDLDRDELTGSGGQDWFFLDPAKDKLKDKKNNEQSN